MASSILVNSVGLDQSPGRVTVAHQVIYYVARTIVLATGERLLDVPVSRRVTSVGIANRLLKRAARRAADVYLVCARRREVRPVVPVAQIGRQSKPWRVD